LLARYGILFRELLENELPYLKWGRVFKSLRLMEFSGEVLAGFFFKGIPGLQFISYPALKLLQADMPRNAVYWMNACDPASLSGIKLESLKGSLPARIASNHLVYHGTHLVLVSRKRGRLLEFRIPPDNKNIIRYLDFFKVLLNRQVNPLKRIKVEEINGLNAAESPYKRALIEFGFKEDYKCLFLRGSV
jgi:ATP-dependent Lhr-like helicase